MILHAYVNDATITALIGAGGMVLAGFLKLIHWAVKEWASVRREAIKAEAEAAAQQRTHNDRLLELQRADNAQMRELQRADNAEMREALLEQARSNTALLAKLDAIADGLRADRDERARRSLNGSRSLLGEHG